MALKTINRTHTFTHQQFKDMLKLSAIETLRACTVEKDQVTVDTIEGTGVKEVRERLGYGK